MPFGPYSDFDDCVAKNADKGNPGAYCAALKREIEGASAKSSVSIPRVRLQIVPVVETSSQFVAGGEPAVIADVDGTLLTNGNEPYFAVINALNGMEATIFVVTGRIEEERDTTERALKDAGLRPFRLIMRPDDSVEVPVFKGEQATILLEEYDVLFAIDNDEDARAAYREVGIDAISPSSFTEEPPADAETDAADDSEIVDVATEMTTFAEGEIEVKVEIESETEEEMPTEEIPAEEEFHSLLVVEGVWTGDGRYIDEGALVWRDLPLPLMATDRTTEGHMDAVLIGTLTRIERDGREVHGWGHFLKTEDDDVRRLQNLIREKALRGISIDLDAVEYEVILPPLVEEPVPNEDGEMTVPGGDMKMRITSARIMGATVVPFPAFQEAYIESLPALTASLMFVSDLSGWISTFATYEDIDFVAPKGAQDEAALGLKWREEFGRGGTAVGVARARDIVNRKNLSPDTVNRMVSYFARHEVDKQGTGWSPGEDGFPSAGRIAWALWGGDAGRTWAEKVQDQMRRRDSEGSIVASGHPIVAPVVPPSEWFANPNLDKPSALTVTDEGRIYGHLAVWGQCHIGMQGRCVEPPSSRTSYAHFLTGEILCEDGTRFPVGQITMNGNHAPHSYGASATAAHYDNTATAVADVTAGEDAFGIWVSGALRPDLEPAAIRGLMASDVSGDWRRIGGNLELVAVLAVNVPGFPKIRVREYEGLVASLSLPAYEEAPVEEIVNALAASIGRSREQRIAELARKVYKPRLEAIQRRVKGD